MPHARTTAVQRLRRRGDRMLLSALLAAVIALGSTGAAHAVEPRRAAADVADMAEPARAGTDVDFATPDDEATPSPAPEPSTTPTAGPDPSPTDAPTAATNPPLLLGEDETATGDVRAEPSPVAVSGQSFADYPRQPSAVTVTDVGVDRMTLTWAAPTQGPRPTGYRIYLSAGWSSDREVAYVIDDPTVTRQVVTGLSRGTSYTIGIESVAAPEPVPSPALWSSFVTRATDRPVVGGIDSVVALGGGDGHTITGWVADPESADRILVGLQLDGRTTYGETYADVVRRDVAAAFPGTGELHGFTLQTHLLPTQVSPGDHEVCVWAVEPDESWFTRNAVVGCVTITTEPVEAPIGNIEVLTTTSTSLTARGWALEPSGGGDVKVEYTVDGSAESVPTDLVRTDVARVHPGTGVQHGFTFTIPVEPGPHEVCLWAVVRFSDIRTSLGCRAVTAVRTQPVGNFEALAGPATLVTLRGWAADPSGVSDVTVRYVVDDVWPRWDEEWYDRTLGTREVRADVARAFPGTGSAHGFEATIKLTPGNHRVCAYAGIDFAEADVALGCRDVAVRSSLPVGNFESLTATSTPFPDGTFYLTLAGWAVDPDTPDAVVVHVYIDGGWNHVAFAGEPRPDVARLYPTSRRGQGFVSGWGVTPGMHTVCAYAIDDTSGNTPLGCRTVRVGPQNRAPVGNFESLTAAGSTVAVTGWALDPDTAGPIDVHLYVDGSWGGSLRTTTVRPDVARAYPGTGDQHGFTRSFTASPGAHRVCAYAIDTAAGPNGGAWCRTVTVPAPPPNRMPVTHFESLTASAGTVTATGWALDPDTAGPIDVHLYVDGAWGGSVQTTGVRADVARAYPGTGDHHGFTRSFTARPGVHEVCAYAIDPATRANTPAGCRSVVVR